jgi:GT2 family glycosyltransferase
VWHSGTVSQVSEPRGTASIRTVRVAAVVLHYRFWPGIATCLDGLQAQTLSATRTLVVDNASDDGSADAIAKAYPQADLLRMESNDGYAAGMNAGLRSLDLAALDFVLLCTHDVRFEPDCLERLVSAAEHDHTIGVVGPVLGWSSRPNEVWSAGGMLRPVTGRPWHLRKPHHLDEARLGPVADRAWIDGAIMLARTSVFERAGCFDERFFLYSEELEWLRRVRSAGDRVVVAPSAVAWQQPGMAPPYLETRNRILLYRNPKDAWYLLVAVVAGVLAAVRSLRAGRRPEAKLRLLAVIDGLSSRLRRGIALQR